MLIPDQIQKERMILMKKKRTLALMLAMMTLVLLTGAQALAQSQPGDQSQQNGSLGQVTQIDGNSITIALASMGEPGGGQNGQAPQGNAPADNNGQAPQGNAPADGNGQAPQGNPPSGDNGQAPQGNPPSGDNGQAPQGNPPAGGQGPSLTLTGETLTFTVDDATQITLSGGRDAQDAVGSLSDISVGSVVTVVLNDSVATSIVIQQTLAAPAATVAPTGN